MAKRKSTKRAKLTPTERREVIKTHAKAVKFASGQRLDPDKRDQLLGILEAFKARRKSAIDEAIALWSAKIDWAIVNRDVPGVVKLIKLPVGPEAVPRETQFWDSNGNCGCGGGGGGGA